MITKTEGVCGGRACLEGTRMPVWFLARALKSGTTREALFEGFPWLTDVHLNAVEDYAFYHRKEIERDIADNATATLNLSAKPDSEGA